MSWPLPTDFRNAIQHPAFCFADPHLKSAVVVKDKSGLPKISSGKFACAYEVIEGGRRWAVRTFNQEVTDQQRRYQLISSHLGAVGIPFMVPFEFQPRGILVKGSWYPIVKMAWVEGPTLAFWVENNLGRPDEILRLAGNWRGMIGMLRGLGVAHADLQQGNVKIVEGAHIRLIDYDGMYVPAMNGEKAPEEGHPNWNHPRRSATTFGPYLDQFPGLVGYLGLIAIALEPGLFKYCSLDNLLFARKDFQTPSSSSLVRDLRASRFPCVQTLTNVLLDWCAKPIDAYTLETVTNGIKIPTLPSTPAKSTPVVGPAAPVALIQRPPVAPISVTASPPRPRPAPVVASQPIARPAAPRLQPPLLSHLPQPVIVGTQGPAVRSRSGTPVEPWLSGALAIGVVVVVGMLVAWQVSNMQSIPKTPPGGMPSGSTANPGSSSPTPRAQKTLTTARQNPPQQARVAAVISSVPPGARLWIDGAAQATTTPWSGMLSAGPHRVVMQLVGFTVKSENLGVALNAENRLESILSVDSRYDLRGQWKGQWDNDKDLTLVIDSQTADWQVSGTVTIDRDPSPPRFVSVNGAFDPRSRALRLGNGGEGFSMEAVLNIEMGGSLGGFGHQDGVNYSYQWSAHRV